MNSLENNERFYFLKLNFRSKPRCEQGFQLLSNLNQEVYQGLVNDHDTAEKSSEFAKKRHDISCYLGYYKALLISVRYDMGFGKLIPKNAAIEIKSVLKNSITKQFLDEQVPGLTRELLRHLSGVSGFRVRRTKICIDSMKLDQLLMLYRFRLDDEQISDVIDLLNGKGVFVSELGKIYWHNLSSFFLDFSLLESLSISSAESILDLMNSVGKLITYLVDYIKLAYQLKISYMSFQSLFSMDSLIEDVRSKFGDDLMGVLEALKKQNFFAYNFLNREVILEQYSGNSHDENLFTIAVAIDNLNLIINNNIFIWKSILKKKEKNVNVKGVGFSFFTAQGRKHMKKFTEIKDLVQKLETDADKFYNKSNSAAGTRVRKAMQDLKVLAQEIRKEVEEVKAKKDKEF